MSRAHCWLLLALSPLLARCSFHNPVQEADPLEIARQKALEEARLETEIGRNMAGRLLRLYGTYPDEGLARYVNEVGLYVARFAGTPGRRYMFEVYASDSVNAFACPGGYILVSAGALKTASNEAELAHVLGHEIAHVAGQHMFHKLSRMNDQELTAAAAAASDSKRDIPDVERSKRRPPSEESPLGTTLARYIAGQTAGLNAIKAAKAGLTVIMEEGLGPELEREADKEGSRLAIQAGYDPMALTSFLCRLETERGRPQDYCLKGGPTSEPKTGSVLDKTHPTVPDRVKTIRELLITWQADQMVGAKGKQRYQTMKQKLLAKSQPAP